MTRLTLLLTLAIVAYATIRLSYARRGRHARKASAA